MSSCVLLSGAAPVSALQDASARSQGSALSSRAVQAGRAAWCQVLTVPGSRVQLQLGAPPEQAWSLILPASWVLPVWLALVQAGQLLVVTTWHAWDCTTAHEASPCPETAGSWRWAGVCMYTRTAVWVRSRTGHTSRIVECPNGQDSRGWQVPGIAMMVMQVLLKDT